MTLAARALLLVAVLLVPDLAPAQAPARGRGLMPADQALRTEALLARAFPGTTFDWERTQLVYPDGRRVAFTFSFYRERPRDGEILIVASHAPDARAQAAVDQLQAFRTPAGEAPRCKLSVMRADAAGNVLGYKETGFDVADAISTCDRVNFDYPYQSAGIPPPSGSAEPAWPLVLISVTTMHVLPDALAAIRWAAVLDTDTLGWVSRLPVSFNGKRRHGESATFFIENDRGAGGGAWIFSGIDGGAGPPRWRVRAPCAAARCKVEPQAVLAEAMSAVWRR